MVNLVIKLSMQLPNEFSNHLPFMTLDQLMRHPHIDENKKPLSKKKKTFINIDNQATRHNT